MTTVPKLVRTAIGRTRVDGILRWAVLVGLVPGLAASAQQPPVHWLHAGAMPPGAIGGQRLLRDGPLSGYFQPVQIRAPQGARIALAMEGGFASAQPDSALVGLQVGAVYRLQVTNIPNNPGVEIFPTVEVIDRLYPPPGLALRYPIPIELTLNELELAAQGLYVTRIIYIEEPNQALPVQRHPRDAQPWIETAPGDDPLVVADGLGRPVAILRLGGRVPAMGGAGVGFTYGCPPVINYDAPVDDQSAVPTVIESPRAARSAKPR
jgi:hypothetical protein